MIDPNRHQMLIKKITTLLDGLNVTADEAQLLMTGFLSQVVFGCIAIDYKTAEHRRFIEKFAEDINTAMGNLASAVKKDMVGRN